MSPLQKRVNHRPKTCLKAQRTWSRNNTSDIEHVLLIGNNADALWRVGTQLGELAHEPAHDGGRDRLIQLSELIHSNLLNLPTIASFVKGEERADETVDEVEEQP